MTNLTSHMQQITKRIPVNTLGLLEGIYRPDLLPEPLAPVSPKAGATNETASDGTTLPSSEVTIIPPSNAFAVQQSDYEQHLRTAYVPLAYEEGYPTLDGKPFWSQMAFEPSEAFLCFEMYRLKGNKGVRQIHSLLEEKEIRRHNITIETLYDYYHTYYWAARAKAADMFTIAFKRREREIRAETVEDEHFMFASRLMDMCRMYLDENGEEMMETLTPKAFIELLKAATQLQRISVGLPGNGPAARDEQQASTLELTLRTVAQQMNGGQVVQQNNLTDAKSNTQNKLEQIMRNPDMLRLAQELTIKMTTSTSPSGSGGQQVMVPA